MTEALLVSILLVTGITPFVLYYFVRAERSQRETMTRHEAEQAARRDTCNRD